METVQERDLHQRQAWWPLDTMACSLDTSSSLFGWDPPLFYLGEGAVGNGAGGSGARECHELDLLVPKSSMESLVSEVSTVVTSVPTVQDAAAMRRELDELLQNLLDSGEDWNSFGAVKEESDISSQDDNHFDFCTIPATAPTSMEKILMPPQAELPSSSSSQGIGDARASDTTSGAQCRTVGAKSLSTKRPAPKEKEWKGGESCKKSRPAASFTVGAGSSVLRPFAVVKPSGTDGEVTLTDINEWILTPPARPVRHPVGEFACGPRVSAGNRPAPSGKMVSGFTRLHTAGRGTITVVRTRG